MWIIPRNHPLQQSLSAQAFVESKEELIELSDLEKSLSWKGKVLSLKTWSQKWKRVYWLPLLFGRTLKHSQHISFEEKLISYLQDIHVSPFQMPAKEKELKTNDTSIRTSNEQLTLFDLTSVSLKTSEDTLLSDSEKSLSRWNAWVTECTLEYSVRRKQAQAIREKEFLSWQSGGIAWTTPVATDLNRTTKYQQGGPALSMQVKSELARPTPDTFDKGEPNINQRSNRTNTPKNFFEAINWPTPTTQENEHDLEKLKARAERLKARNNGENGTKYSGNGCGPNLATVASSKWGTPRVTTNGGNGSQNNPEASRLEDQVMKGWGTPTTRDYKDGSAKSVENVPTNGLLGRMDHSPESQDPDSLNRHGNIRASYPERLNPLWVCQLMGITFEKTFFVHLETPCTKILPNSPSEHY